MTARCARIERSAPNLVSPTRSSLRRPAALNLNLKSMLQRPRVSFISTTINTPLTSPMRLQSLGANAPSNSFPTSEDSPDWSSAAVPRTFAYASAKAQTPRTQILMSQIDQEQAASPRSALWINQKRSEELAAVLDTRVLGRRDSAVLSPRSTEVLKEYQHVKSREEDLKHDYFRSLQAERVRAESREFLGSPKTPRSKYLAHGGASEGRNRYGGGAFGAVRAGAASKRLTPLWSLVALTIVAVLLFVAFGLSSRRHSTATGAVEEPISHARGEGGNMAAFAAPLRGSSNRARRQHGEAKEDRVEEPATSRDELNNNPLAGIQTVEELDRFVKAARSDLLEAEATTADDDIEPMHDADEGKG